MLIKSGDTVEVRTGNAKEMPIDASNVLYVCTACGKAARLGTKQSADGGKVRVCRKCGAEQGTLRRPRAKAAGG
jgi:large subunit ribosomal protein L24